jgi:hypothetical protein
VTEPGRVLPGPWHDANVPSGPRVVPAGGGDRAGIAGRGRPQRRRAAAPGRSGLSIEPLLPFEAWRALGMRIAVHSSASAWWLGDWLIYGQAKYGRRYKDAIAATGLDYQTLRNYAVVARRFDMSRRRDTLTFHHHAELCALPNDEQDAWLDLAGAHGWSRNELRRRLRPARAIASGPTGVLRLEVATERERRWRAAADHDGCALEEWMLRVLDDGARLRLTACEPPDGAGQQAVGGVNG